MEWSAEVLARLLLLLLYFRGSMETYYVKELQNVREDDLEILRDSSTLVDCVLMCKRHPSCSQPIFVPAGDNFGKCYNKKSNSEEGVSSSSFASVQTYKAICPCENGGTCNNDDDRCLCPLLYRGYRCEIFEAPRSCKEIKEWYPSTTGKGEYPIMFRGTKILVHCDMDTDGGGWLRIAHVNTSLTPESGAGVSIHDDVVTALTHTLIDWSLMSRQALISLREAINFTQLKLFCVKKSVGRVFHIATATTTQGMAVVNYLTTPMNQSLPSRPLSCGSFVKMADDSSILSIRCDRWAVSGVWGYSSNASPCPSRCLYTMIAYIPSQQHITAGVSGWYCDDASDNTPNGVWAYHVR